MGCFVVKCERIGGIACNAERVGGISTKAEPRNAIAVHAERIGGIDATAKRIGGIRCRVFQSCAPNIRGPYLEISPTVVWILAGQTQNDVFSNTYWTIN